jgi:hypothetical protein
MTTFPTYGQVISDPLGGTLPFQAWPQFAPQGVAGGILPLQVTPAIETQATNSFLHDVTSGPIRKMYEYLDKNSPKYSQLADCVPIMQKAVESFGLRDYAQAFLQLYQAYRYITLLRASVPDLPSL